MQLAHDAYKRLNCHPSGPDGDDSTSPPRRYKISTLPEKVKYYHNLSIQKFATIHGVSSQAYCVYREKSKLKPQYMGMSNEEIRTLLKSGVAITDRASDPFVAFSGDTTIEGLVCHEDVMRAEVLIVECTYISSDDSMATPAEATKRGHIHEQHLIEHRAAFHNQVIVLTHISTRYRRDQILSVQRRIAAVFAGMKVLVFDPRVGNYLEESEREYQLNGGFV